jgi:quinolinate synthase
MSNTSAAPGEASTDTAVPARQVRAHPGLGAGRNGARPGPDADPIPTGTGTQVGRNGTQPESQAGRNGADPRLTPARPESQAGRNGADPRLTLARPESQAGRNGADPRLTPARPESQAGRNGADSGLTPGPGWADQVRRLAAERDAVILAHNYQLPEIQDVADHVGDSLALSRLAAESPARVIVFAGVYFMAETAKILSPDKTVLIPDQRAGCSLADSITAAQLREWKAGHPGAAVVAYVNTSAEVKAEADVCCTSSNAAEVVDSIPAGREVLFCPDQFLGAHVRRVTGRQNMLIWAGECHVHAAISGADLAARVAAVPEADLFIHPECGCATSALYLAGEGVVPSDRVKILSTGGMATAARQARSGPVLVATEIGMLHQLRKAAPGVEFLPVNDRASCRYMKMITPAALVRSLREGRDEVHVDAAVASRAGAAVRRMISIGRRGGGE